jgi:hypothetical protein
LQFADACDEWCSKNPHGLATEGQEPRLPPRKVQLKIWRCRVQAARRVATFKHRVAKSKSTSRPIQLKFGATSQRLHKQEPDPEAVEAVKKWECCSSCSRWQTPDIFEVMEVEESVVPRLDAFQTWLRQRFQGGQHDSGKQGRDSHDIGLDTIVGLYSDEFAWRAWIDGTSGQGQEDEVDDVQLYMYQQRHRRWDAGLDAILLGTERVRWEQAP